MERSESFLQGGVSISVLHGHLTGLKASQLRRLERLGRRRVPPERVLSPELARATTELSLELGRQIGLLLDRSGSVVAVTVGTDREITIPDLSDYRLGRRGLRGIRCLHTHLKNEPLTQDDLTDLALLRLDLMGALGVLPSGLPGTLYLAHLLPPNPAGKVYEVLEPAPFHAVNLDLAAFLEALEEELSRANGTVDVRDERERAILVSASSQSRSAQEESLAELAELARSDNVVVLGTVIQRIQRPHPKFLLGEGKLKDLVIQALQQGATLLIFDQNLTPGQVKAIGDLTEMKVIDRTQLILDIFARRAHSRDGKVQVELAQLKYRLPRLVGKGTAMSRLAGGIGGRGPGETKLEVDRRRVRDRIAHLERELQALSRSRQQRRVRRVRAGLPIVSIVGYTNAGKSTLLNALTDSQVHTEDLLFATLDTSTRRLRFPQEREVIITDTVGFIRELPPDLLGAFRATLDELRDAHLLLHVVDLSNPRFEQQMASVEALLEDLDLAAIPRLLVFNKKDRVPPETAEAVCRRYGGVAISALDRSTFGPLLAAMEARLWPAQAAVEEANPQASATA